MKIKDIKYVYFDLDGTFLSSNKTPLKSTLAILDQLKSKGIKCSIATGRTFYFAQKEINLIKPTLPIISCNSSLIYDSIEDKIIYFNSIKKQTTKNIFNILIENNAVFFVYTTKEVFIYKNPKTNPDSKWINWFLETVYSFEKKELIKFEFITNPIDFKIENHDVVKFLVIYSEMTNSQTKTIKELVNKLNDVYIVHSQKDVFDIMPIGSTKGEGLKILDKKGIIDLNHTLVFGDADNDIDMFLSSKWSVAMGNANEEVKKNATFITSDNDNDGIFLFFKKIMDQY
ncbi:MAG: HAD family hydrolase [Mycoplasmataceae bacterium]|nr:HAD family hydrolase [Mycoplasmataceae bacterium]